MYLDLTDGSREGPRAGDWLVSRGKSGDYGTAYYVIEAYQVRRRDPAANPRFQLKCETLEITDDRFIEVLKDARRGKVRLFEFHWYPRDSKRLPFAWDQVPRRRA